MQTMQDFPLRVSQIIDHAALYHPERKIISRSVEGPITETTWKHIHKQAKKLSQALISLDVKKGDTIGVMAWNTARHMEVWFGIPGSGAINHTLNPRLFAEQLIYIINHAEDKILMVDLDLVPVIEKIIDSCPKIQTVIILTDRKNIPETSLKNILCYEDLLREQSGDFEWVSGDEREPCGICYTSGTTGNPKGVTYTHRSNVLHALTVTNPDMLNLSSNDRVMPVVPLFHANGWSVGYSAPLSGSSLVLPGREMTPEALYEMLEKGVTITLAVPTVWLLLLNYLDTKNLKLSTLKRVVIGGSACPRAVIEKFQNKYGVQVLHAWGMTEMSPLGTICSFKPEVMSLPSSEKVDIQETTGHSPFSVQLQITDDDGKVLAWDGKASGKLWARGAAVVNNYHKEDKLAVDKDGWFDTGDVATIDKNGYMRITDRSKDVIKSGGEWISSIELENAAIAHDKVAEAAAIGVAHPKWDERPVIVVVSKEGSKPDPKDIIKKISERVAKWQVPDDVIFMDNIPHTATGKISKMELRNILKDLGYQHPDIKK